METLFLENVIAGAVGSDSNRNQDTRLASAINTLYTSDTIFYSNSRDISLPEREIKFSEVKDLIVGNKMNADVKFIQISKPNSIKNDIMAKIEMILKEVNELADSGKIPKLKIRNQTLWTNCIYDMDRVSLKPTSIAKKTTVVYTAKKDTIKFNAIIFVLTKIHEMLSRNVSCTRRELYYQNVSRLKTQVTVDMAVRDVCCLLEIPPWQLGITATVKGLIAGPLTIVTKDGLAIDCMKLGGVLIPPDVVNIKSLKTKAKFILVVEKDAIFQKLLDEGALTRLAPVIIITGKGYPDMCTRQLLVRLCTELNLKAFALVDYDPHGYEIFLTYKFGSLAQSHISESLCCSNLKLLGVFGGDVRALARNADIMPLTHTDKRKLNALLIRPYLQQPSHQRILHEIREMFHNEKKAETECVASLSTAYLTDTYLPEKIINQDFI